jgi:two-component system NtrC family sensor kinase
MSIGLRFDGPEIVIEIGDTGPGISPEHVSKIFDPFFTTGGDKRRSGLGLSVSHSIVRQHGGNLTVRTAAREGTTFTVRLPAAREDKRPAPAALEAV